MATPSATDAATGEREQVQRRALAAHAWWLPLTSEDVAANVAAYHLIAGNRCLDHRVFEDPISREVRRFSYKGTNDTTQEDCNQLSLVLDEITKKAHRFIVDAAEKRITEAAGAGGLIATGQSFDDLLSYLRKLEREELEKVSREIASLITEAERPFIRKQCDDFCVSEGLSVVITDRHAGFKKGKLCRLSRPQDSWSGNALYVTATEAAKQAKRKISGSTNRGAANASVKKRMQHKEGPIPDQGQDQRACKKSRWDGGTLYVVGSWSTPSGVAVVGRNDSEKTTQQTVVDLKQRQLAQLRMVARERGLSPALVVVLEGVINQEGKVRSVLGWMYSPNDDAFCH